MHPVGYGSGHFESDISNRHHNQRDMKSCVMCPDSVGKADQFLGGFNSLRHLGLLKFLWWIFLEGISEVGILLVNGKSDFL